MRKSTSRFRKYGLAQARRDLPDRLRSDNKTHGGKCLVLAGSKGMWGAAVLTATAAARSGAGYVYVETSSRGFPTAKHPDFLMLQGPLKKNLSQFKAVAVGPGLKDHKFIRKQLKLLRKLKFENLVIDAEGLSAIENSAFKRKLLPTWILTPHEGELSRLLGVSSAAIRANRRKYVELAQSQLGCVVVLKGFHTLVADAEQIIEIQSGNPALAKAGTGDVLTGIILAFLSQGLSATRAAALGTFVHGFIADAWVKAGNDILSLMASDIVEMLPKGLASIRKKRRS